MTISVRAAVAIATILALPACTDGVWTDDVKSADLSLTLAAGRAELGETYDKAELLSMPGLEAALHKRGLQVKSNVAQQLRDPTDPIWGEIWTPDLVTICGTVNGRNAYGAYAGSELFYATDGKTARLAGSPLFKAAEAQACQDRSDPRLILRADRPKS